MANEGDLNLSNMYNVHDKDSLVDDLKDEFKLKEFLKKVDTKFYHKIIENRQQYVGRYFPHRGETGTIFNNTYQYLSVKIDK